jgi:hypothetical protein
MAVERQLLLAVALIIGTSLGTSLPAVPQGTYPNGVRSGYAGTNSSSSTTTSAGSSTGASSATQASRNLGTGQGRTEGAMGLSPQLQKEMGISRQQ